MQAAHWLFTSRCFVPNLVVSMLGCFKSFRFYIATCHFHNIFYNLCYLSRLMPEVLIWLFDFCQELKHKLLCFWTFYLPYVSVNSLYKYYTTPTFCIAECIYSSILWRENAIGSLRILFVTSRGAMNIFYTLEGIMKFLPSQIISNQPSPQYLLTTPLPNIISSIFYM